MSKRKVECPAGIKLQGSINTVLDEAHILTSGEKQQAYGHPHPFCERLALVWSGILERPVTGREVYLCLAALKLVRQAHKPGRDNLVDLAGYARVGEMYEENADD